VLWLGRVRIHRLKVLFETLPSLLTPLFFCSNWPGDWIFELSLNSDNWEKVLRTGCSCSYKEKIFDLWSSDSVGYSSRNEERRSNCVFEYWLCWHKHCELLLPRRSESAINKVGNASGQYLASYTMNRVLAIHVVQWLSCVLATQKRKNDVTGPDSTERYALTNMVSSGATGPRRCFLDRPQHTEDTATGSMCLPEPGGMCLAEPVLSQTHRHTPGSQPDTYSKMGLNSTISRPEDPEQFCCGVNRLIMRWLRLVGSLHI